MNDNRTLFPQNYCRTCGHSYQDHEQGCGACSHVRVEEAVTTGCDLICGCAYFRPWAAFVIDVWTADRWDAIASHTFGSFEEAERFALAEISGPYGIRRDV